MIFKSIKTYRSLPIIETETGGERIELKIERILNNEEQITDGARIIWQERKEGVNPAYNIRADKWDIAIDAMDAASRAIDAQREDRRLKRESKNTPEKISKPENNQQDVNQQS